MEKLQHGVFALILAVIVMAFLQLMPQWHDALTFHSESALSQGWPLISAHFIHLDWTHALFNYLALAVIVAIWHRHLSSRWLLNAMLLSAVTISLLLLFFEVQFVGLSGVIHGLLLYCLIRDAKQHRWMWLLVVAVLAKVVAELLGWRPAHFVGDDVALIHAAGLISALVLLKLERRRLSDAVPEPLKNKNAER